MQNMLDFNIQELETVMKENSQPAYRAKQVFEWLHRGVVSFDAMTNIPLELRKTLSQKFYTGMPKVEKSLKSSVDGTVKYLLRLFDDSLIECVLLRYDYGNTLCISSQVGCRMGCSFCASAKNGLIRNLTPGEMVGQVLICQNESAVKVSNIVIMGSGEPLDNYDNVVKFLRLVNIKEGLGIGLRHITVSTCGLVERIDRLSEERMPVTLSVSLHAADDNTRKRLMPVAKKYKIKDVIDACGRYLRKTGRRVTFEYIMIEGENDAETDAYRLARLLEGMLCHVNIIRFNSIQDVRYKQPHPDRIKRFKDILDKMGVPVTVRREMGSDISGACGQLKAGYQKSGY